MRGLGELTASPALGDITGGGEPGGGKGRGPAGGRAGLGCLSAAVSKEGCWITPGTLSRGRGPCGSQSKRLGGV